MRWLWVWTALGCLVTAAQVSAGDGEQLATDQLPPELTNRIREGFDAEPLHARKEIEGGKACYVVTATYKGQVIELYTSPDGAALVRKTEAFSLARWTRKMASGGLFLLLPLVVVGALTREVVRAARGRSLSVPEGWLSAWAGAGVGMALVVFNLATVPREKDVVVLGAYCIVWRYRGLDHRDRHPGSIIGSGGQQATPVGHWLLRRGCCVAGTHHPARHPARREGEPHLEETHAPAPGRLIAWFSAGLESAGLLCRPFDHGFSICWELSIASNRNRCFLLTPIRSRAFQGGGHSVAPCRIDCVVPVRADVMWL